MAPLSTHKARDVQRQAGSTPNATFPVMVKVRPCKQHVNSSQEVIVITSREHYQEFCRELKEIFKVDKHSTIGRPPNIGKTWTDETIKRVVVHWELRSLGETILHEDNIRGALALIRQRGGADVITIELKEVSPEVKKYR
ncbi:MAG: hypothetical protein M1812_001953 [Candelaria pacifica]|nr:MAG: hypothetical protein M1812_001953 [Candelaria pacifica]